MDIANSMADAERLQAGGKAAPEYIGNVLDAVIKFEKVTGFTTFLAEYAIQEGSYIVHFFPPKEQYINKGNGHFQVADEFLLKWKRVFPQVLSPAAEDYFGASQPRLQAAYTAEMTSWWFKAAGFADCLAPDEFILAFFEKLDAALDASRFLA